MIVYYLFICKHTTCATLRLYDCMYVCTLVHRCMCMCMAGFFTSVRLYGSSREWFIDYIAALCACTVRDRQSTTFQRTLPRETDLIRTYQRELYPDIPVQCTYTSFFNSEE